jgi:phosphatidylglycerol:prolipoprotein diacylglycerol transferase
MESGLVGARLLYVLDRWPFFVANPAQILAIHTGGLSIMGAILGGGLTAAILARRKGLPVRRLFDATAPGIVLGQAIGRFGCLVTGDTVVRPTDGSWGIVYLTSGARVPQLGVAYQPAFFYEQLWGSCPVGVRRLFGRPARGQIKASETRLALTSAS